MTLKRITVLFAIVFAALLFSAVVAKVRAQHVTVSYSIKIREVYYVPPVSVETFAQMSPEKQKLQLANASVRERFEGQRSNGDHVTAVTFEGLTTTTIKLHQSGLVLLVNNKNSDISTSGTGVPTLIMPVTPECKAFVPSNLVADSADTILGFKTIHVHMVFGNMTTESWYAPALGCQEVKRIATRFDGAQTTFEAVEASINPPPDEMFEPPANAVERKPSEFWRALTPLPSGHSNEAHDAVNQNYLNQDARYERDRAARKQGQQ